MPCIVLIQALSKIYIGAHATWQSLIGFGDMPDIFEREIFTHFFLEFSIKNKFVVAIRPYHDVGLVYHFPERLNLSSRNLLYCFYFGFWAKLWPLLTLEPLNNVGHRSKRGVYTACGGCTNFPKMGERDPAQSTHSDLGGVLRVCDTICCDPWAQSSLY